MTVAAVFTRREPSQVKTVFEGTPVISAREVENYKDSVDVMIMCGGSATDLPVQTPEIARIFNVVDSFDTHARIAEHFKNVDSAAKAAGKRPPLFPSAGTRVCFLLIIFMPMQSSPTAKAIPSGERASARDIPTPSEELTALRTQGNTPFPFPKLSKESETVKTPS